MTGADSIVCKKDVSMRKCEELTLRLMPKKTPTHPFIEKEWISGEWSIKALQVRYASFRMRSSRK